MTHNVNIVDTDKKPWSRRSLEQLKDNIINQIRDLKKHNQQRFEIMKEKQQGD